MRERGRGESSSSRREKRETGGRATTYLLTRTYEGGKWAAQQGKSAGCDWLWCVRGMGGMVSYTSCTAIHRWPLQPINTVIII